MAIPFAIGSINVNSQNTNATISIGQNQLPGWAAHRKTNNGQGIQAGLFLNTANGTVIIDTDLLDGQMNNANITPSAQGQTV
ncbi:hypothetical protein MXL46_20570 [Heyndrickxia sporothermodurans]|uniref:Uncharacterized protein n=1 Tax=Heyndrickxia sporothermodurans TaxID=46224 RepID=A0AB37HFR5_9BACI|nr:hypothetical protein [Heyndrickxia sporothermodurans]MBL5768695.1 hypothetical protein [Heyndrickxia sporothermodurans]MBL5772413.1 hypothetical protein [Heyndrickxia sporothermodurans]MBL5775950.1 hypothetical protein [Heyndrickxia sporothermodurans]MBL5779474.1 hypothetical protein [Heyndrickxia sporothermodurans]MBL5783045.1 hypothetical protein [Heyndrickxia sporothermodurans]